MKFLTNIILLITTIITLASCKSLESHGRYVSAEELDALKSIKASKSDVVNKLGSPNLKPSYSKNTWYYVSRIRAKRSLWGSKTDSQRVVKLVFKDNNLHKTYIMDNRQNDKITLASTITPTKGSDKSMILEFFNNIGRFNKKKGGRSKK